MNWERRKGTTPSGEGRPRKAHGRRGGARKVEQDGAMFRPRVDIILTRQPSFDPSPAHVVCAEGCMWGVQIRHITAAQTLSGLTL